MENLDQHQLIAEDGTSLKWSLADLPKEEQDSIKQKPWLKAKGVAL